MGGELRFCIPGEVRGKGRPRATAVNGQARMFTDSKTRSYETRIADAATAALGQRPPLEGPLEMHIRVRLVPPASTPKKARVLMIAGSLMPTKKPDLDNVLKAILDGCNKIAFQDDVLVVKFSAVKIYADVSGVDVLIRPYIQKAP